MSELWSDCLFAGETNKCMIWWAQATKNGKNQKKNEPLQTVKCKDKNDKLNMLCDLNNTKSDIEGIPKWHLAERLSRDVHQLKLTKKNKKKGKNRMK